MTIPLKFAFACACLLAASAAAEPSPCANGHETVLPCFLPGVVRPGPDVARIVKGYTNGPGFEAVSADELSSALESLVSRPDADTGTGLSAAEAAMLLVEAREKPLLHARYVLRYTEVSVAARKTGLVSIERYNLGPVLRADAASAYGASHVASAKFFGKGSNVIWRFVMPLEGHGVKSVSAASRRIVPVAEARRRDCLSRRCLSLDAPDDLADWKVMPLLDPPEFETGYPRVVSHPVAGGAATQEFTPAFEVLRLALAAHVASVTSGGEVRWSVPHDPAVVPGRPDLVAIIDRNLGQEIMSDSILGIAKSAKDKPERWVRIGGGIFDGVPHLEAWWTEGPLHDR